MRLLTAAVSALALAATPALAQGNGKGNGNGNGNNRQAAAKPGNGNGNGNANRGNRGGGQEMRGNRGNGNGNANRGAQRAETRQGNPNRGNGNANRGNGNANRGNGNAVRMERGNGNANRGNDRVVERRDYDRRDYRDRDYRNVDRRDRRVSIDRVLYRDAGYINNCPPGLAKKRNGCQPPGQAKKQDRRYSRYNADWWGLPYRSGNYYYDDGYLMRYDGNRISGFIPLLGGALSIGNRWPTNYGYRQVPDYYSGYYGLGDSYRYADNVVYRLDPETAAITSIAALLTGNEFNVGQPMPRGYDVYNVPYSYRDRYYDRPDAYYRYNDGYVYQIDPETRLIAAAIELLV